MTYLEPLTDGTLTITLSVGGVLKDDATVVADVYTPRGVKIAANQSMTATGGNTGQYVLSISKNWSSLNGVPLEGEYLAVITATRQGVQRVRHIRYNVFFDDTE